ncbi:MAG: MFS transporter [bacterium]|nr:MFS transporter [bacterium]
MRSRTRAELAALATVPFIMVLGNSMLIPVLPQIGQTLDLGQARVGLLITAFSLPAGLVIPWAGLLSDRVGRVTVIAPALILYGLGGLAAGLASVLVASPFLFILGARVIQGIGAGGTYQLALALAGDIFQSKERSKALGLLEAANGLGKVVSPVAGAAAALVFWFAPFFVYGVLALPAAALVWLVVREPEAAGRARSMEEYVQSLRRVARAKAVPLAACFLAGMASLFLLFGVLANLSDVLEQRFNVPVFGRGLIIALPVLGLAITAYVSGTVLQREFARRAKLAVVIGLILIALGVAPLPWMGSIVLWTASTAVAGIGVGLALPSLNTLITSSISYAGRGLVTALYGAVRFFGVAIGPPAFGMVETLGSVPVYLGGAGVAVIAVVVVTFLLNQERLLPEGMDEQEKAPTRGGDDGREETLPGGSPPPARLHRPHPVRKRLDGAPEEPGTWWKGGDPF